MARVRGATRLSPTLKPKGEKLFGRTTYFPNRIWEKLAEIEAIEEREAADDVEPPNRTGILIQFTDWAIEEWERDRREKKKK